MRDLITLTDEQIEAAFEAIGAGATCSAEYGCDIVFTAESLADFETASINYAECRKVDRAEATLILRGAQPRKGDQRADVFVIDFGAVRGVWK